MRKLRQEKMGSTLFFSFMILFILGFITPTKAAAPQVINSGSQGIDVWEVQQQLYELNLYEGFPKSIEGVIFQSGSASMFFRLLFGSSGNQL